MRKYIVFLLCLMMILSLVSCNANNGNVTKSSDSDTVYTDTNPHISTNDHTEDSSNSIVEENNAEAPSSTESSKNDLALKAYGAAIRNEISVYYPLIRSSNPRETYFKDICGTEKGDPSRQALIDMDKDGIEELILVYDTFLILLHFENNVVYGTDFHLRSMETIYTDGSFSWSASDIFGNECGISRVSFTNGIKKVEELCRAEGDSKFFIGGIQVTKAQYNDYINNSNKTPIQFTPFDIALIDSDTSKAIELACAHWGIKDGDFDPERGFRYRVVCSGKMGDLYRISLYRFIYNSYYEHLEIASVNIETGEISVNKYPDGKG